MSLQTECECLMSKKIKPNKHIFLPLSTLYKHHIFSLWIFLFSHSLKSLYFRKNFREKVMIQNTTTKKKIEDKLTEWKKQKHYLRPRLTILDLSKMIGINRTYVSNFINDSYGLNFNTWINHLRIEEAKIKMTLTNRRNLTEIAEQVGFTDLAHFSKQFKLKEGVSPSEWRRTP